MAESFSEAIDILAGQLRTSEDDHRLRWHLVRSLAYHRAMAFEFNEKSRTLAMKDGVWQYTPEEGLPGDIMRFVEVTLERSGSNDWPLQPTSLPTLRRLHFGTSATGSPSHYTWFERGVWVWPIPSGTTDSLILDYYSDASRDETTGALIDEDSVEETNVFLREAEGMLFARAAYTYLLAVEGNSEGATQWKAIHEEELHRHYRERDAKKLSGRQVAWYL